MYIIKSKYKRALLTKTYVLDGLNRRQFLLLAAIQIMQDKDPKASPEEVIQFIFKEKHLPKEVAELKLVSEKSLLVNLTLLLKKGMV